MKHIWHSIRSNKVLLFRALCMDFNTSYTNNYILWCKGHLQNIIITSRLLTRVYNYMSGVGKWPRWLCLLVCMPSIHSCKCCFANITNRFEVWTIPTQHPPLLYSNYRFQQCHTDVGILSYNDDLRLISGWSMTFTYAWNLQCIIFLYHSMSYHNFSSVF